GRPTVVDSAAGVAAIGRGTSSQLATMTSLEAPDFELPDLAGVQHTLSAHRGKKVLLIAYASW
ncbi:MAG: peroxiredoxin family protein, partial [bacterium]